MRVALIGGTGFVGSYLVDALLEQSHAPVLLVRHGSESKVRHAQRCACVSGGVDDAQAVRSVIAGADAVIYCVGILREFPSRDVTFQALHFDGARLAMDIAGQENAGRFLFMSANGVKANGTGYQATKHMAEQYLQTTGLRWTIYRPSVLFGDPRGRMEFATQLHRDIVSSPLPAPFFHDGMLPLGAGAMRMSPIHVQDVARVFVDSLPREDYMGRIVRLGGPRELSWKEILGTIARVTGRNSFGLPAPAWAVKAIAGALDRFEGFPITRDQITMLMEGNTCDSESVFRDFGIAPIPFDEAHLGYLSAHPPISPG